jgi:hypothetical protein
MASSPILEVQSTTQQQPTITRTIEAAGQTFRIGVPVQIDTTTGAVRQWDGTTTANAIAGISKSPGQNLSAVGTPAVFGANLVTGQAIVNQPLAKVVPVGAPLSDGRTDYAVAVGSTVFFGQVGPTQTTAPTDVGAQYGMTADTDGQFYVDKTKTGAPGTATTGAVVKIVKVGVPVLGPGIPTIWDNIRGVHFVFLPAAAQKTA